jgi:hypothetical protein
VFFAPLNFSVNSQFLAFQHNTFEAPTACVEFYGDALSPDKMPCKGDELCCDEEAGKHPDFDTPPKASDSNGYSSDSNHPVEQPTQLPQPQQPARPLTNGFHEGPKQILVRLFLLLWVIEDYV